MPWPSIGKPLPRAEHAFGVRQKLVAYSLNVDHKIGRAKAERFRRVLGITSTDVEYLVDALSSGVLTEAVTDVRDNSPFGVLCEVRVLVVGLHEHHDRSATVTTSWELHHLEDAPRLVTAYIDG